MRIAIYGCGVVGEAYAKAYEGVGHDVLRFDNKFNGRSTKWKYSCELYTRQHAELFSFNPNIIYICLPTPSNKDGSCDISIIESELKKLCGEYLSDGSEACIVIKSTIPPGTCDYFVDKFGIDTEYFGHSPEFLKERTAEYDAKNQKVLITGTYGETVCQQMIEESNKGFYEDDFVHNLVPSESELLKYYHNSFNALRIIFSIQFAEMAEELGVSYDLIKDAMIDSNDLIDEYHDVSEDLQGYSGPCLPKDTKSIVQFGDSIGIDMSLIRECIKKNESLVKTVLPGMRED
jgi:UDPglucose 6-dehydrogenase